MKNKNIYLITLVVIVLFSVNKSFSQSYKIVDTGQQKYFNNSSQISAPNDGADFFGQDAQYLGYQPSYTDNGNGTVTDNNTGLMWAQTPDLNGDGTINVDDKLSWEDATAAADTFSLAGYDDWRLPTIKEQYSLILFSGIDVSGYEGETSGLIPFIDTDYFEFGYGDEDAGERIIDAQFATSNIYVSTTMMGDETMFGVNFADGRIKGYGTGPLPGQTESKLFYVYFVRGADYGINDFEDNGNGTITDNATGLMWMQDDNGSAILWKDALDYCENLEFAGYNDWRLPNAKELQSILDYTRSPETTNSAAIDPIFNTTSITDEGDNTNWPFYWTSTTHENWTSTSSGGAAVYVCFGEALGWMEMPPSSGTYQLLDVHGAGSQRSDFKTGDPTDYPYGHGPQGDVIRIYNYVRPVRDIETPIKSENINLNINVSPNPTSNILNIYGLDGFDGQVTVCDLTGKIISSCYVSAVSDTQIDVSFLNQGVYFLTFTTENGEKLYQKFVKE
ncbi:MAG: DUF1566 domain-containing protein [Bacteroidales bacterium]|nr:DUF1566 domain-containing protein [Bacteroidales bacterium]